MDVGGRTINSPQSESRKEENIELSKLELLLLSSNDASAQAEEDSFLEKAKLKSKAKVVSAWNNMKYGTFGLSGYFTILESIYYL